MKILKTLFFLTLLTTTVSAFSQVNIGLHNTRYAFLGYKFKDHYSAAVHVSVFSEKLGFQYAMGSFSYNNTIRHLSYEGKAYFGSAFNRSYYNGGAAANLSYDIITRLSVRATLNPHYDSGYGYKTCYKAGIGVMITPDIDIFGNYTTIPEYRMSEKRIHVGADFHVKNLNVTPVLSIGTTAAGSGSKNIRVLMSFAYSF